MKLPEIFKNKLNDNVNNNKKLFISMDNDNTNNNDIFISFPVKLKLTYFNGEEVTSIIVGKTKNYLITKNRNVIYLKDLKEIKKA